MSLLAQVTTQNVVTGPQGYPPMRLNIQGTDGIGKSTFASKADDVIFLQAEDGLGFLEAARFPKSGFGSSPTSWLPWKNRWFARFGQLPGGGPRSGPRGRAGGPRGSGSSWAEPSCKGTS